MGILKIERTGGGGFAPPNLPGSAFVSNGETSMAALSKKDQEIVESLFANPPQRDVARQSDAESYRITRSADGKHEAIDVPEGLVPAALRAVVTDKLR